MKIRSTSMKLITAACAMIALAAIWGAGLVSATVTRRGGPAAPTTATAASAGRTDLDVFALNADRTLGGKINGQEWQDLDAGYNIVRSFRNAAGQPLLFALNGNTGAAVTFALNNDGSVGAVVAGPTGPRKELRCDAAEFVRVGATIKLVTQSAFTGFIRTFTVSNSGAPDLGSMTKSFLAEMEDKNLFEVYDGGPAGVRLIGVNTWTGEMVTYSFGLQKITAQAWTRGWTSIDHARVGDVTYRLLYKASGDPYKKPGESGDQARRFLIETVASDGSRQTVYDNELAAEYGDYSSVRFVQLPAVSGGVGYGILFYRRTTSDYALFAFDPQAGLGARLDSGRLKETGTFILYAPPYIDVAPYVVNGKTCLAFVSPDGAKPLGFEAAEEIGRIMHDGYAGQTVGYQFILAQSGRIFFSRAGGKAKLDHNQAAEIAMSTRKQMEIGSVAKLITTLSVLKLAQRGDLKDDLSDKIIDKIDASQIDADSWAKDTPVLHLLTHTTGVSKANKPCKVDDDKLTLDCTEYFNAAPDLKCGTPGDPDYDCIRKYNNSNIRAVRKVIEKLTGALTAPQIVEETQKLWADAVDLEQMTCKIAPDSYYYGPCNGAGDCFNYGGKSWRREYLAPEWLALCSSGHWYASSREMIEFMAAIRYRKALNEDFTNLLLATDLVDLDGDPTAVGWDTAWDGGGEKNLNKGGYFPFKGVAAKAHVTRLPNNCDAVLQLNSESDLSGGSLLREAYKKVVLGQEVYHLANGEYTNSPLDTAPRTFINTARVGASNNEHVTVARGAGGSLNLKAFRASPQLSGDLALVAEKTASAIAPAFTSEQVAITDGAHFVTASLGAAQQINLISWEFNGSQLIQHASAFGPQAKELVAARVASQGTQARIVTAIRTLDNKLQLDVWDLNHLPGAPQFSSLTHRDKFVTTHSPAAIAISNLGAAEPMNQTARFVIAYDISYPPAPLQVETWEVGANGQLDFKKRASFDSGPKVAFDPIPNRLAIDAVGDGDSTFFGGNGFNDDLHRRHR